MSEKAIALKLDNKKARGDRLKLMKPSSVSYEISEVRNPSGKSKFKLVIKKGLGDFSSISADKSGPLKIKSVSGGKYNSRQKAEEAAASFMKSIQKDIDAEKSSGRKRNSRSGD